MTLRPALALALTFALAACGASAGPAPAGDAAPSDADAATDAFPCGAREALVGGQCVPVSDSACGPSRRVCTAPQRCAVVSGAVGQVSVDCVAD